MLRSTSIPSKGAICDIERICASLGFPLKRPDPFPQHSLLAARIALVLNDNTRPAFSRSVFQVEFGEGRPIAEAATLAPLIEALGLDAGDVLNRAQSADNKERLRIQNERATELGLPGAPCLVTSDGEAFWGNDRLEEGLEWARKNRARTPNQTIPNGNVA
ncbi:MAG: DsbA family protein [Methylocystis silviterrae]